MLSYLPVNASKVWTKIKGFFKKAWSAVKKVIPAGVKVASGTALSLLPGGTSIGTALISGGVADALKVVETSIRPTVVAKSGTTM